MKIIPNQTAGSFASLIRDASNAYVNEAQEVINALMSLQSVPSPAVDGKLFADLCRSVRMLSAEMHRVKMSFDWHNEPAPEWFDHFIDQHYQFSDSQNCFWVERGVYGVLTIKKGGRILELCCGDGFNTRHFYAGFAEKIIAVDFDPDAIAHAQRYNAAANIEFMLADVRTQMPDGSFDNIMWDAAIEHFTEEEIATILGGIKNRLTLGGTLSGYTIVEREDGVKSLHQHEREFRSMNDLLGLLKPYFKNVRVFETIHARRHNLYFYASDSTLPFDKGWVHGISSHEDSM